MIQDHDLSTSMLPDVLLGVVEQPLQPAHPAGVVLVEETTCYGKL